MNEVIQTPELRSSGIGGSDAAIILGISQYSTPLELAQKKLGLLPEFEGNIHTEFGNRFEDPIAQWYAERTGSKIARVNDTLRLKDHNEIMAHLDRRVLNQRKVLEVKTADIRGAEYNWGDEDSGIFPEAYMCQVQHYLMFPQFDIADLAVMIGKELRIYPVMPDDELQDMILRAELEFWQLLLKGELPEPSTTEDTKRLYKVDNGQEILASAEVIEFSNELTEAKKALKDAEKKVDELKTNIQAYMGDASFLMGPDGKINSWKIQGNAGFDESGVESEYPDIYLKCSKFNFSKPTLKKDYPAVYNQFQGKGRVFR